MEEDEDECKLTSVSVQSYRKTDGGCCKKWLGHLHSCACAMERRKYIDKTPA